ncbi:YkyA family protein [Cytobacillus sp. Hz8]|uniref:YkyA family protein n=1 Tax=Cytobacillus sp. Hz8 TaxID=3347168 RepID=UPI0035DAFED1
MSIKLYKHLVMLLICGVLLLSGCFQKQTKEEQIYNLLESVASTEQMFEEQQNPLVDLEKNEKTLYDKIIALGKKEQGKINQLSDQALQNIKKRKEHMQKEQDSMEASEKEFKKLDQLLEDIKDEKEKKKAETLRQTMKDRYKMHDELYANYNKGLEYDKELYILFKNKNTTINQLEEQIVKINQTYEIVISNNENFNKLTKKYNEEKIAFYKEAKINVEK